MSYELTIMPGTDIALFWWSGPITLEDRKRNIDRIAQFCSKNGISKLIVDTRQMDKRMSVADTYDFGTLAAKKTRGIQVAYVPSSDDTLSQFGQNVAFNRGAQIRSFVSIEEAQRWLAGE